MSPRPAERLLNELLDELLESKSFDDQGPGAKRSGPTLEKAALLDEQLEQVRNVLEQADKFGRDAVERFGEISVQYNDLATQAKSDVTILLDTFRAEYSELVAQLRLLSAVYGRLPIPSGNKDPNTASDYREEGSGHAQRVYTLQIPVDKIRDVIGPGGKVIRSIIEQTGVKIDVEDSGKVNVASNDEVSANKALQIIRDLTASAEVGKTYLGKVSRLTDFGAFVEILPGLDGLLHISEVAEHRIKDVRDELREGDQILVKVLAVEGNRIKLSRKAILKEQRAKMATDATVAAEGAPSVETSNE